MTHTNAGYWHLKTLSLSSLMARLLIAKVARTVTWYVTVSVVSVGGGTGGSVGVVDGDCDYRVALLRQR